MDMVTGRTVGIESGFNSNMSHASRGRMWPLRRAANQWFLDERYESYPREGVARLEAVLCGDAPPGLPRPVHYLCARHDGGQYRARHQLLDGVSEVSLAGPGGFRDRVALAAVPAVLGRLGRARGPLRPAPDHPDRHESLHHRIAELELFLCDRHPADVAGDGDPGHS